MNDENPGTHPLHFLQDVGAQQNGFIGREAPNQLPNSDQLIGIQAGSWFVQNQNLGVVNQGLGQTNALAITLGQLNNPLVRLRSQTRLLNDLLYSALRAIHLIKSCHRKQIFPDIHVGVQRIAFGEVSQNSSNLQGLVHHILSAHLSRTAVRL